MAHGTQNKDLNSWFQCKNRFEKFSLDAKILSKTEQKSDRHTKSAFFGGFGKFTRKQHIFFKSDFCLETVSSDRMF